MNLKLYQMSSCPYCIKVFDAIDALDIKDKIEFLDISDDKNRNDLISLTGDYQVPCLVIDEKPMLESDDIITFLNKSFPE